MQSNLFGFYSLNQSDMCNIYLFVVWGCVAGRLASEVPIYECSDGSSRRDDMVLEVDETSPKDTSVAMFSHTTGRLQWAVSINGTYDSKLGTFFTTENSENDTVVLKLVKKLDLELLRAQEMITPDTIELIEMKIRCQDTDGATQFLEYDLRIQPKNEFHPVFNKAPYKTEIAENTVVGTELFNLKDKTMDMDFGNTELIFDIEPYTISEFDGKQYVTMDDPQSGKILLSQQLDYEAFKQRRRTYFLINVTVADDGGFKSVTSINVTVLDKNDLGIEFEYPGCQTPCLYANYTAETNEAYTGILDVKPRPLQARDLDTLNARIQYTLTSDYDSQFFQVDEITGDMYQTSPLTNDSYGYAVNLQVYASEVDDDSHFLLTNITVFIEERKQPSNLLLVCKCCILYNIGSPLSLKLRYKRVEMSSKTLRIQAGRTLDITCDAALADKPLLRWYGKRGSWIANEGKHNRIHIEHPINYSRYKKFQKLVIQRIRPSDTGTYTCRGVLADSYYYDAAYVNVEVYSPFTSQSNKRPSTPRPSTHTPIITTTTPHTNSTTTPQTPSTTETTSTSTTTSSITQSSTTTTTASTTTQTTETTTTVPSTTKSTTSSTTTTTTSSTTPSTTSYVYSPYETTESDECNSPDHLCGDGLCIREIYVCDGLPDCVDSSDESNCSVQSCAEGKVICTDKSGCVSPHEICDGVANCKDASDEDDVFCKP